MQSILFAELTGQLVLSVLLGTLVGLERELARKSAGMRTYALVALGSTVFSILSIHLLDTTEVVVGNFDPSRIAAQVVSGVGFLGAGLIIFSESRIQGITTAAGVWVTAAIGMAVGFRFYMLAIIATGLSLFIFLVLWGFEERLVKKYARQSLVYRFRAG